MRRHVDAGDGDEDRKAQHGRAQPRVAHAGRERNEESREEREMSRRERDAAGEPHMRPVAVRQHLARTQPAEAVLAGQHDDRRHELHQRREDQHAADLRIAADREDGDAGRERHQAEQPARDVPSDHDLDRVLEPDDRACILDAARADPFGERPVDSRETQHEQNCRDDRDGDEEAAIERPHRVVRRPAFARFASVPMIRKADRPRLPGGGPAAPTESLPRSRCASSMDRCL
jgi:hypothetical protein